MPLPARRVFALAIAFVSSVLLACAVDPEESSGTAKSRQTSCEPDTNVQCLCGNGSPGIRYCDKGRNLLPCKSRGRVCTSGDDDPAQDVTPVPAPTVPPAPREKADAGAEPPPAGTSDGGSSGTPTCVVESEPNDEWLDEDPLTTTRCGALDGDDEDLFYFEVAPGGHFDVTLTTSGDADIVVWEDAPPGQEQLLPRITPTHVAGTAQRATTYIVSALSATRQTQSYTVRLGR